MNNFDINRLREFLSFAPTDMALEFEHGTEAGFSREHLDNLLEYFMEFENAHSCATCALKGRNYPGELLNVCKELHASGNGDTKCPLYKKIPIADYADRRNNRK